MRKSIGGFDMDMEFRNIGENPGSYSRYLVCDDLTAPIGHAIGKEKLQELLKTWKQKHEGKIAKGIFSVRFRDMS